MIRIARLTDYGIVLLTHFAREGEARVLNAPDLAEGANLPLPTVSKLLKLLSRAGLLASHRGVAGGYRLARAPEAISVAQIIGALEGPIAMTECSGDEAHGCSLAAGCPTQAHWRKINAAVRGALEGLTLADMTRPVPAAPLLALRPAGVRADRHHAEL